MAFKDYKVSLYRISFGHGSSISFGGVDVKAIATIRVGGTDTQGKGFELNYYFCSDDSKVPDPPGFERGNFGGMVMPARAMPYFIDVLRNEKPVWIRRHSEPSKTLLSTSWEPSGVGDDNT